MGKRDGVLHVLDISRIREISEMAQTTWETTTAILEDQSVLDLSLIHISEPTRPY